MKLTPDEVDLFYKLHTALLCYANQQLQLVPDIEDPEDLPFTPLDEVNTIRQALYADPNLIERFAEANPYHLSPDELDIVRSWVHLRQGSFYIFRYLKRYTVFLDDGDPPHAYGVLGLRSDFDELVGRTLPRLVEVVLLPFRGKIVFDGLLSGYNIFFGSGIKGRLKVAYRSAKEREGIITDLVAASAPLSHDEQVDDVETSNKKVLKAFHKALLKKGLLPRTVERHVNNVDLFTNAFLAQGDPPCRLSQARVPDIGRYFYDWLPCTSYRTNVPRQATETSATQVKQSITSLKQFFRFMRDSERMDIGDAWDILDDLKGNADEYIGSYRGRRRNAR